MNNCLNCCHCTYCEIDGITGHWCRATRPSKKIRFPLFKGGSKKCECYVPYKEKPNILTEYPKKVQGD